MSLYIIILCFLTRIRLPNTPNTDTKHTNIYNSAYARPEMDTDTEEEKHEVEPFQAGIFTSSRNIRNPGSRVFHCCLIVPLLLILAFAITSLSYFAVMDEEVRDLKLEGSGKCVLFARWNKDTGYIDLNSSHACTFSIFGEVSVAVLAALLIVWMIVKTSAGFHMLVLPVQHSLYSPRSVWPFANPSAFYRASTSALEAVVYSNLGK